MVTGSGRGEYERTDDGVFRTVIHRRIARLLIVILTRGVQCIEHRRSGVVQLPHVLLEVKVPAKTLAADLAGEGFFVVVRVHVEGQIVDLVKRLVTDVALVCLFAAVRELVILVVTLLVKTFAAELADKWLEIGVYARMSVQGGATVESLAAGHAFVRLLGCVDDLMPAEGARLPEALATDLANEWPCTRVHRHVSRQIVVRVEHLAALGTSKGLLLVRGAELAARCRTFLIALIFRRYAGQTQSRRGFLNGCGRWRTLRDRWRRSGRAWEGP